MPELYRTADLFVLASLFEMMPIALIEAAASGLPCITHDHPIMRWMTGAGGVQLDMSLTNGLTNTLGELLNLPSQVSQFGHNARRHCQLHFSRDAIVTQVLRLYSDICDRHHHIGVL
jgi:1,2-diacylglycerol 3-alpha-glucosyltransferase